MAAKDERTPLAPAASDASASRKDLWKTLGFGFTTILCSVGLINFNSYLMADGRFPYAAPLVLMHMAFCSTFALVLRFLQPSLYPALTDPHKRVPIDADFLLRGVLPIGAVFSASLVLTNLAYNKLSVAFLQMLKECNIILVYAFSLIATLEMFSWRHVQVIFFAMVAASLTITGELNFVWDGFCIQVSSMVCECLRIVLQSVLLSGKKLDALSYVLVVSPVCFLLLGSLMLLLVLLPPGALGAGLALPTAAKLQEFAPLLAANCALAFALNVSIALLIKNTSAVSYIFCGVLKDILAVLVSVVILHESISPMQCVSFSMQILAVVVWSLLKSKPENFENGLLVGVLTTLGISGGSKQPAAAAGALPSALAAPEDGGAQAAAKERV
mmetsp:Transcript_100126/g.258800  ORF Transcript_100126/g.258800 Transcript_100126/m.258800 type:complete len:386 (-) Transcript_100126:103-1260(-)